MSKKTKHKIEAEGGELIQSNQPIKIRRGGMAVPLGNGFSLLKGKKHSQGGIDIDLQGDAKIWSSVPFLNGLSPAERVLDGENPDKVFAQQESYKERYGIKDDGSKKRFGGEDEKYTPLVYKDIPQNNSNDNISFPLVKKALKGLVSNDLSRSRIFLDKQSRYGLNKINTSVEKLFIDPDDGLVYGNDNVLTPKVIRLANLKEINKDSAITANRKELDYIGGDANIARKNFFNKIPKSKQFIIDTAKKYNINPNLLLHRMAKEGVIDQYIHQYNNALNKDEQTHIDGAFLSMGANGFQGYGLDDVGTLLKKGKIHLKDSINWWDEDNINEKGRQVNSATGETNYDNIILKAATMNYIKNELLKRKDIPKDKIDIYTNAAYNLGLYHNDLNNREWIEKNYAIPTYTENKKQMGGNINKNGLIYNLNGNVVQGLGYIPSTGRRQKAKLGKWITNSFKSIRKGLSDTYDNIKDYAKTNPDEFNDYLSAGINTAGTLGSYLINKNMLDNMSLPQTPISKQAIKLKTNYNINPQLDAARETENRAINDINNNTTSSNVALARINQARFANMLNTNTLYGNKENVETELINQDRQNQQTVLNANIDSYNQHTKELTAAQNQINEAKSENLISGINNIAQGFQDIISRREQRKQDNNTKWLHMISAPNAPEIPADFWNWSEDKKMQWWKNKDKGTFGNDGVFYTNEDINNMSKVERERLGL